ncbi:hypothetical protein D9M68_980300 [compost metagenome]
MSEIDWNQIFDNWGIKSVTSTDKKKRAYVLSAEQRLAVIAADITPSEERPAAPFTIVTPLDPTSPTITSSF